MFYQTYINYIESTMTCYDTANLKYMASLCPQIYGTVVYQSRALFTAVFNELRVWNDDSCFTIPDTGYCQCSNGRRAFSVHPNTAVDDSMVQQYVLSPNPNNGTFSLHQIRPDASPVIVTVHNVLGQILYYNSVVFNNLTTQIQLDNTPPGPYLLELINNRGRLFTFKFVVR